MNPKNVLRRFTSRCPLLYPSLTVSILGLLSHPAIGAEWDVAAKAAVLMEMPTGKILWEKNKEAPRPPASTAKILTALVTLDRVPLKEIVTVIDHGNREQELRGCPPGRRAPEPFRICFMPYSCNPTTMPPWLWLPISPDQRRSSFKS